MTCTHAATLTDPQSMRDAIRRAYVTADADAIRAGHDWYAAAEQTIAADAAEYGLPFSTVAAVYAACSINASWAANRTIARRWLAYATGHQPDRPGCLAMVATRCELALAERPSTYSDAWRVVLGDGDARGSKVASFMANMHGDREHVTIDRWAMVGAGLASLTAHPRKRDTFVPCSHSKAPKGRKYDTIRAAYRDVAAELGIDPRDLQAAVWCAVRGRAN